jgi:hypothetical protein
MVDVEKNIKVAQKRGSSSVCWLCGLDFGGKWADIWVSFENTAIFFSYGIDFDKK